MDFAGKTRWFCRLIVLTTALFALPAQARELRIGVISDKPVEVIENYNPLVRHLVGKLSGLGITGGRVIAAKGIPEMVQQAKKGEIDVLIESAFATVTLRQEAGMLPRLLVWKKGVKHYTTLFFVRKESPIRNLKDLTGKIIAFESPNSTSAYLIPKAELRLAGLTVLPLEGGIRDSAVNYVFAGRDINQTFQVIQKKADAGAFSSNDWDEIPEKMRSELTLIHRTRPIIRYIASFHPSLPEAVRDSLIQQFVQMDKEPEGAKALQSASRISRIERLTDEDLKSLDHVKILMKAID